tara:strand:+ start:409 stop:642 length:234 start_codon:yes stop_codon:yes gene_type:complete
MTVENAHSFLDELQKKGHSPELMAKIGTDFQKEHIHEALKQRNSSKDDLLAHASGGSKTTDWISTGAGVAGAAAAAA